MVTRCDGHGIGEAIAAPHLMQSWSQTGAGN